MAERVSIGGKDDIRAVDRSFQGVSVVGVLQG